MAGEIKVTAALECTKGNFKLPKFGGQQQSINQTGTGGGVPGMVEATTAGVDVSTTGLTNIGWCYIKNIDATNFMEWGPKVTGTFHPIGKLLPGEEITFRLSPGKTLHVKGDTATVETIVQILEA